jgi:hypothetical protein
MTNAKMFPPGCHHKDGFVLYYHRVFGFCPLTYFVASYFESQEVNQRSFQQLQEYLNAAKGNSSLNIMFIILYSISIKMLLLKSLRKWRLYYPVHRSGMFPQIGQKFFQLLVQLLETFYFHVDCQSMLKGA